MSHVSEEQARRWLELTPLIFRRLNARAGEAATRLDLSATQAMVVFFLQGREEMTMGKLSEQMCMSVSTMTGVIDRLVRKGAVSRRRDQKDRRVVKVRLTPAGMQLAVELAEVREAYVVAALEAVDEPDRGRLLEILEKLAENLARQERSQG